MNNIRIPMDLRDFVENGLIQEICSQIRFVKKSSAEMTQLAYCLFAKESNNFLDIDI